MLEYRWRHLSVVQAWLVVLAMHGTVKVFWVKACAQLSILFANDNDGVDPFCECVHCRYDTFVHEVLERFLKLWSQSHCSASWRTVWLLGWVFCILHLGVQQFLRIPLGTSLEGLFARLEAPGRQRTTWSSFSFRLVKLVIVVILDNGHTQTCSSPQDWADFVVFHQSIVQQAGFSVPPDSDRQFTNHLDSSATICHECCLHELYLCEITILGSAFIDV